MISKKNLPLPRIIEFLKTMLKCKYKNVSDLNLKCMRFRVRLYTQSLDLQSGSMTARNNSNSFPYFFQVSLPVSKCPDSVSKADKKLYVEKDFTAELASVLPTFPGCCCGSVFGSGSGFQIPRFSIRPEMNVTEVIE